MWNRWEWLDLIAQAPTSAPGAGAKPSGDAFFGFMLPLLLFIGAFYLIMFRGQRKERKKHADLLSSLKRNDRVQTIGGVLGTVVEVREHEVVLKVDETSNVKMRFNRGAIKEVLASPGAGANEK
jgi:preprotein translocase subunit YajC